MTHENSCALLLLGVWARLCRWAGRTGRRGEVCVCVAGGDGVSGIGPATPGRPRRDARRERLSKGGWDGRDVASCTRLTGTAATDWSLNYNRLLMSDPGPGL